MDPGVLPPGVPGWGVPARGKFTEGGPRSGMSTDKVPVCGPQGQTKDHSTRTPVVGRGLGWILGKLGRNLLTNLRACQAAYAFLDVGDGGAGFGEGGRHLDGIGITHGQPSCEYRQTDRLLRCYIVREEPGTECIEPPGVPRDLGRATVHLAGAYLNCNSGFLGT